MPSQQQLEEDLHREDIEEIFSSPPTTAIRSVLLSIAAASILLAIVFWFIKVPAEAEARIVIVPQQAPGDFRGYAIFSQQQYPLVKSGDSIRVAFSCFPEHEYGTVKGYIRERAYAFDSNGQTFTAIITFSDPLISSKGTRLLLLPEMSGTGMVRSSNERMLNLFLGNAGH